MNLQPLWLAPIRYGLPLVHPVVGAQDRHDSLRGLLVGCAAGDAQGWMTAADLPDRPQWHVAIAAFARSVAADQCRAAQQGLPWPQALAARWGTGVRTAVPVALTADLGHVRTGRLDTWIAQTGSRAVKIKVGVEADEAVLVAALAPLQRRYPELAIRLDCNQSWGQLADAELRTRLAACARLGVASVEDPTPPGRWPSDSPVPLAADLVDMQLEDFLTLARRGELSLAVVKPALLGSIEAAGEVLAKLAAWRVPVALSSLFDAPRGLVALAAIAAASPGEVCASGLATHLGLAPRWRPPSLDVIAGHWQTEALWHAEGGCAVAPDVADRAAQAAVLQGSREAIRWAGQGAPRSWTWQQWHDEADRWAAWLARHGVQAGARVAAWRSNSPETALLATAVQRLGAIWAPLHPRATQAEIASLIARIAPRLTVADGVAGAVPWPAASPDDGPTAERTSDAWADPRATRALVATSGTTGAPRVACLSGLAMAVAAAAHWQAHDAADDERWLACLPMSHVSGWMVLERVALAGATAVLTDCTAASALMQLLQVHAITTVSLVPTQLRDLVALGPPPTTLRMALIGGASLDPHLHAQALQQGWPVVASYGMTETCAQAVAGRVREPPAEQNGARRVGRPLAGLQVRVQADGEIALAGPQCMTMYWQDDAATTAARRGDWLCTGDLGFIGDDGALWVSSRREDRIICGGENVDPAEVEACLREVAGVLSAVAVGVAHERWGEVVGVWLQVTDTQLDWHARTAEAVQRLAPYKRPQLWLMTVDPPPTSRLDKVSRAAVREALGQRGVSGSLTGGPAIRL